VPPSLRFDFDRYPYLTSNLAGIGGQIRQQHTDFQVTEIPAYPTSGEGEHLFVYLEKEGLTTS
jgi:tRNA pseudouridine13 synthase